jgi:hypothetical protein
MRNLLTGFSHGLNDNNKLKSAGYPKEIENDLLKKLNITMN